MENEYIKFEIKDDKKFNSMISVYNLISKARNLRQLKPDEFWLKVFPEYAIKKFYFGENDVKPNYETSKKTENVWNFSGLVNLLQKDLDVEYFECTRKGKIGKIEFSAEGYPYGGITGLTMFLNSFDCKATEINEGVELYSVKWISDNGFKLDKIIRTETDTLNTEMEKSLNLNTSTEPEKIKEPIIQFTGFISNLKKWFLNN